MHCCYVSIVVMYASLLCMHHVDFDARLNSNVFGLSIHFGKRVDFKSQSVTELVAAVGSLRKAVGRRTHLKRTDAKVIVSASVAEIDTKLKTDVGLFHELRY